MATRDITQAAADCRRTGLGGWDLVDHATRVVSEQFSTYSVLHPWESPKVAFQRRRGFCTQYNGALAILLEELGFPTRLVYVAKVRFDDRPEWTLGHTWVLVRFDGEIRDACARSMENAAGRVHFVALSTVRHMSPPARVLTTLGSFVTAVAAIVHATWRRQPRPDWVEHSRDAT